MIFKRLKMTLNFNKVIGENEARISTIDMLRHIELRMETLTQEQEILNQKKVNLDVMLYKAESK